MSVLFPKPKTFRSEKYLKFVRSLPCCVCGWTQGIEAHHSSTGGTGIKCSDAYAVPMCRLHHAEYHQFGKETFWGRHNIDKWELVARTLEKHLKEVT